MEIIIQFQLHIFSVIILLILYSIMRLHSILNSYGKTLLRVMVILTALAVIVEALTWIFEKETFFGAYFLEYTTNFLLVLLAPLIASIMFAYVNYKIQNKRVQIGKQLLFFPPTIFTLAMLLINFFYPIYFTVEKDYNSYVNGDFRIIHYLMIGGLFIFALCKAVLTRNKVSLYTIVLVYSFFLLPIIGMILSLVNSHIFFTWTSISLSIFVIYIFLETESGELDYLTKLFNRQSFEKHVEELIQINKEFQLLYLDLDRFKQINDEFGHLFGDRILIAFGNALRKVFKDDLLVSRLGGDEYMVVVEQDIDISKAIESLKENLNMNKDFMDQEINFSYGYSRFKHGMTLDEVYASVDNKMYEYKRNNRKLNRRSND